MKHFYLRNRDGLPVACVATEIVNGKASIIYAVATYNPRDKFDKNMARQIAQDRLKSRKHIDILPIPEEKRQVKQALVASIFLSPNYPARTRQAARLWLQARVTNNGERAA